MLNNIHVQINKNHWVCGCPLTHFRIIFSINNFNLSINISFSDNNQHVLP